MGIFREYNEKNLFLTAKYLCLIDSLIFQADSQEIKLCIKPVKDSTLSWLYLKSL